MTAVAKRSGVARATVYLRYPNRRDLLYSAIRAAMGRQPFTLSGDLETDLRRGVETMRATLGSPIFRAALPRLVQALLRADDASLELYQSLAPNRERVADEYRRLAPEAGWRTDIAAEVVTDVMIGGPLSYPLATGAPPSPEVAQSFVDLVLDGVKIRS